MFLHEPESREWRNSHDALTLSQAAPCDYAWFRETERIEEEIKWKKKIVTKKKQVTRYDGFVWLNRAQSGRSQRRKWRVSKIIHPGRASIPIFGASKFIPSEVTFSNRRSSKLVSWNSVPNWQTFLASSGWRGRVKSTKQDEQKRRNRDRDGDGDGDRDPAIQLRPGNQPVPGNHPPVGAVCGVHVSV